MIPEERDVTFVDVIRGDSDDNEDVIAKKNQQYYV